MDLQHEILGFQSSEFDWQAVSFNIDTGRRTSLAGFDRLVAKQTGGQTPGDTSIVQVSPDGKWALWGVQNSVWSAARLDGKQVVSWRRGAPISETTAFAWEQNSRHWIEIGQTQNATPIFGHDLAKPNAAQTIPVNLPYCGIGPQMWMTKTNRVILENTWSLDFRIFDLKWNPNAPLDTFGIPFPNGVSMNQVAVSPGRDRMAWITVEPTRRLVREIGLVQRLPFLRPLLDRHPIQGEYQAQVWINTIPPDPFAPGYVPPVRPLDTAVHRVGPAYVMPDFDTPNNLQWTPDGTRLMFDYKDRLWIMPVPPTGVTAAGG